MTDTNGEGRTDYPLSFTTYNVTMVIGITASIADWFILKKASTLTTLCVKASLTGYRFVYEYITIGY